jgi:fibronectin-binding autotransporter adhesin
MKARGFVHSSAMLAATILGLTVFVGQATAATYYTVTAQAAGNWTAASLWNTSSTGAGGTAYTMTNPDPADFVVLSGGLVRSTSANSFQGHSLTINSGGEIRFKLGNLASPDTINFNAATGSKGLILNGGTLDPGDNGRFVLAGSLSVAANSMIDLGAGTGLGARIIDLEMSISGSNSLSLVGTNGSGNSYPTSALVVGNSGGLAATSTFTGMWNIQAYGMTTNGANVLGMSGGSGGVGVSTLNLANGVTFDMSASGNNQAVGVLLSSGSGTTTLNLGANTLTINGPSNSSFLGTIQGSGGVTVNSAGSVYLGGANLYTGPTTIAAGTLYANGSSSSGTVSVTAGGATLAGTGTVTSQVNVTSGGVVAGGQAGAGALTISGPVNVRSGGILQGGQLAGGTLTVSGPVNVASGGVLSLIQSNAATLNFTGGLTFNGSASINFSTVGAVGGPGLVIGPGTLNTNGNAVTINITGPIPSIGNYGLIGYSGVTTSTFTLGNPLPSRAIGSLVVTNGSELDLNVTSLASIIWRGTANGNWDTTSTNWVQQGAGATQYIDNPGDSVIFDDSAGTNTSIAINGADVHPSSVTFNNNLATYTISGSNAIAGRGSLQLTGTGTVILLNSNTFTGATSIGAGATLRLGNGTPGSDGSLSNSSGISDNGLLVFNLAGSQAYGNIISGSGAVSKSGPGLLTLANANTYSGATTINGGTLQIGNGDAVSALSPSSLIANNGMLVFNRSNTVTQGIDFNGGALTSSGGLGQAGHGTLVLNVANTYTGATVISAGTLQVGVGDTTSALSPASSIVDNGTLVFNRSNTVTQGTDFSIGISGSGGLTQAGSGTMLLNAANSYSGPTTALNGLLIAGGSNANASSFVAANSSAGGLTVLSIRNSLAVGSGTADSGLAAISLNATGGALSTSILEIGATIGTDTGGHNADFSYQVVAPGTTNAVVPGKGQISLGSLSNNNDGTGFAAYNANSLSTPRIVALYATSGGSLQVLQEKTQFGQGSGDHITLGSPTANNTLVLLNPIDLNGGPHRRWASIRGVGITPEGEFAGSIVNTAGGSNNVSFDGNGGLIFDSAQTSYTASTLQINGGAVFVAASDPAQVGQTGALGSGTATMQVGTSTNVNPDGGALTPTSSGANLGFMTYGPNGGVGPAPTVVTNRNINVGGNGVTYASVVLGGVTNDYSAMNGNIALNQDPSIGAPTTFTARNGGRVDFGTLGGTNGIISGIGSVVVGNSIVEGDASAPGIALNNNGTIVFNGANTYSGTTSVTAGKLYINGGNGSTITNPSAISVASGATLGGQGTINGPVTIFGGGILEAGQVGAGTLTVNSGLTFNGPASINIGAPGAVGSPPLLINNVLNTNGNTVSIDITGAISGVGNYALINYNSIQTSMFTLATPLPNRALGSLVINGTNANELDLDVTSLASIVWRGNANTNWDTTTTNWVQQGAGATQYIDNPGDSVIFDDTAGAHTAVSINSGNVHPSSVTFNNNSATYTISGSNGIAGNTGLQLTGSGTVIVLNANTFTGETSIGAAATLQLGNGTAGFDGSIPNTSGITDNGSLVYNLAGSQVYGGIIGGSGTVRKSGPGILTLTNSSTFTGAMTINGGTVQLGKGTVANDGALTGGIVDNSALVFNYFGNVTYAGALSGSGAATKIGVGSVTLAGVDTVSGGFALNAGGLQLANSLALENSTLTLGTSGTLSFAPSIGSFVIGGLISNSNLALQDTTPSPILLSLGSNSQNTTFGGVLSAAGSLTKAGSGVLTLTATNTYTGNTLITGGTLALGNSLAIQNSTLDTSGAGSLGLGGLTSVTLGGLMGSGNLALNNAGGPLALTVGGNGVSTTYSGGMSGSGSLNKVGGGILTLTGTNTYSGGTTLSAGEVSIAGISNIGGPGASLTFNGGVLQVTGTNLTSIDNLAVNWSTFNGGFDIASSANTFSLGNALSGTGGLTKSGPGVLLLMASSTFSGPTAVNGGTLNVAHPLSLQSSTVTVNSGGVLTVGSSATTLTFGALGGSGTLALNNNTALTVGGNGATTGFGGVLGGVNGLTKIGNGTMSLVTPQNYSGTTTIAAGTLQLSSGLDIGIKFSTNRSGGTYPVIGPAGKIPMANWNNLAGTNQANPQAVNDSLNRPTPATVTWGNVGDSYDVFNASQADQNAQLLNSYLDNTATGSQETITISNVPYSSYNVYVYFGSDVNARTGFVTIDGSSVYYSTTASTATRPYPLVLATSTTAGTYSNGNYALFSNVTDGTLVISQSRTANNGIAAVEIVSTDGNGASSILPTTTPVVIAAGATLDLNGANQTVLSLSDSTLGSGGSLINSLTAAPATLTISPTGGTSIFSGQISGGSLNLVFNGPGAQILAGNNTSLGTTTINGGTMQIGAGGATGSLPSGGVVDNSILLLNIGGALSSATVISGSGNLVSSGSGLVTLSGLNTYTGGTTISGGTLAVSDPNDNNLGASNGNLTIGPATLAITLNSVASVRNINLTDPNSTISVDQVLTYANSGTVSGSGGLSKIGAGTLNLSGVNTYTGGTNILAGTLQVGSSTALGLNNLTLSSGGVLDLAGNSVTVKALNGSGMIGSSQVGALLTVNNGGMYAGSIQDSLGTPAALTLAGGTLTLQGANAYSGPTNVKGGALLVNGSLSPSSTIAVAGGAVLGGIGTAGDATVANGGIIDVSRNNGSTLTLAGLFLGQTSTDASALNFSAGNPNVPQLAIGAGGLVTNGGIGSVTVNIGGNLATSGTYTLATYSSIGGTGASALTLGSQSVLTSRQSGALVVTSNAIDWVVNGYYPIWTGANSSQWVGGNNWKRSDTNATTDFLPGDTVVFDDSAGTAGGTTNVTISGSSVSPRAVTFNNNSFNYSVSGAFGITGSGVVILNGSGAVTLSTSNSYSGGTTINAGLLQVGNASALGSGPLTLNGGALTSAGTTPYTFGNALTLAGSVTLGDPIHNGALAFNAPTGAVSGNAALTINSPVTITSALSGFGGSLTKNGAATLTLAGNSSYDSGTTINAGLLRVGNANALGSGTVTVNNAALSSSSTAAYSLPNPLSLSGNVTLGDVVNNGALTFAAGSTTLTGTTVVTVNSPVTIGSSLAGAGASLTTNGPSILTLTGANSYDSGTTINGGTLAVNGDGALGTAGGTNLTINGGVLAITASTTLTTGRTITLGASGGTMAIPFTAGGSLDNQNTTGVKFSGSITGSGGLTIVGGSGSNLPATAPYLLVLNGGTLNNYTGNTTIINATVTNDAALGTAVNILPATTVLTLANSAVYAYYKGTSSQTLAGLVGDSTTAVGTENNSSATSLTINPAAGTTYVYAGAIGDIDVLGRGNGGTTGASFSVTLSGQGVQVFTGSNYYTGGTTITSGTLVVGGAVGSLGSGAVGDNSVLAFNFNNSQTVANTINGSGSVAQLGGLTLLGANNGYSGGTRVSGGTLQLGSAGALGTGGLTANAGTVDLDSFSPIVLSLSGSAGRITNSGSADSTLTDNQTGTTIFNGSLTNGPTNKLALVLAGTGTLTLGGNDTYTGGTVVNSGILIAASATALANGSSLTVGQGAASLFAPAAAEPAVTAGEVATVPEPGTLALLVVAVGSAAFCRRLSARKKAHA